MKNGLTDKEVERIDKLNNWLIALEEKIYNLAKVEYLRAEQMCEATAMEDYEVQVNFIFSTTKEEDEYGDYLELASWEEGMHFYTFENEREAFGINDKYDWNVSSSFIKNEALNTQRHCWLLHQLYDNYMIGWEKILRIDHIYYDIVTQHDYEESLEDMKYDKE